jgi:branched-chain amino acid transport system substrate-binding protein
MAMKRKTLAIATALALMASLQAIGAATNDVVIGDIDDLSGNYADVAGTGAIEAMNMAIADFGGTVLGRKIVTLVTDHQNKPDIGASKLRAWADQNGLNMLLGGSNTGVSIAMAKVAAAKKIPFFALGAGGSSLTNEDCTAYTIHYVYDTTSLANGTAATVVKGGGKTWFYLSADYAFGAQLQDAASKVVEANGGRNIGAVRVPLQT